MLSQKLLARCVLQSSSSCPLSVAAIVTTLGNRCFISTATGRSKKNIIISSSLLKTGFDLNQHGPQISTSTVSESRSYSSGSSGDYGVQGWKSATVVAATTATATATATTTATSHGHGTRVLLCLVLAGGGIGMLLKEKVKNMEQQHAMDTRLPVVRTAMDHTKHPASSEAENLEAMGISLSISNLNLRQLVKLLGRMFVLGIIFLPPIAFFPLSFVSEKWNLWWWRWVVSSLDAAGPTFIKFGQWASTRPDLFPRLLCRSLRRLQNNASPHSFAKTEAAVMEAFGRNCQEIFSYIDKTPVGSGCVAQVHRAYLRPEIAKEVEGVVDGKGKDGNSGVKWCDHAVAVKVLHPGVKSLIAKDLAIMHLFARLFSAIPTMKWLSLDETVEQFAIHMERQLDMEIEALNLEVFRIHFKGDKHIRFPQPAWPFVSKRILIESYCDGEPVAKLLVERNKANPEIAKLGLDAFLKMMLHHNFVHADLHPGNVLVVAGQNKPPEITFLDAGLICKLSPNDRKNFLGLFTALLDGDGRHGAALMVENARDQSCLSLPEFQDEMQKIFDKVRKNRLQELDIGGCLAEVLEMVRKYQVKIESNFATLIMAIIVAEGLGRKLDPDISLVMQALPFVFTDHELRKAAWNSFKPKK